MARLAELVEAHVNPLMLKETYQGFRGGALRMLALLALLGPLTVFGTMNVATSFDEEGFEQAGRSFFFALATALCFLGWLASVRAAQQLYGEIKSHSIDLILLTALTPWQLAVGRFQAAVMQVGLLFAFALPFATASVAMGGMNLAYVAGALTVLLLLCLLQCSAVLAGATAMLISAVGGGFATVAALAHVFTCGVVIFNLARGRTPDAEEILWIVALIVLGISLFLRLAADILTPSAARTFALSKVCLAALLAVFFLPLWLGRLATDPDGDRATLLCVGLATLYLFAFAWSAARERRANGAPAWRRLLDDGYDATLIYCGVISAVVWGAAALRGWPAELPILCFVYFVFLTGIAVCVHSYLPATARTSQAYTSIMFWLGSLQIGGAVLCRMLRRTLDSQELVSALETLFPFGLTLPVAFTPWFMVPPAIGIASIAWARRRNARLSGG